MRIGLFELEGEEEDSSVEEGGVRHGRIGGSSVKEGGEPSVLWLGSNTWSVGWRPIGALATHQCG